MAKKSKATHYLKSFCWQHFRKRCKDLTPEERREFLRVEKAKSREHQTEKQREMQRQYCKKYRETHREQIRETTKRYALSGKYRKADAWRNTFCYQYFGKRLKDLTKEELAIYRHLMYIGYGKTDEENARRKVRAREMRMARKVKIYESQKVYYKRNREAILAKRRLRNQKKKTGKGGKK